jgi:membrane-associated phospholipid phosphatase
MKHAGSRDELLSRVGLGETEDMSASGWSSPAKGQSRISLVIAFACSLLLIAIVADAPVRDLAKSLDPSLVAVLRVITEFGNSAWPLSIGLMLLAAVVILTRRGTALPSEQLRNLRSMLLLMVGSVALSGVLANLAKNVIGRMRPSKAPDAEVLEFAMMTFRAGWASFPSGHATTATACALALAISCPSQSWAWLSIGLLAAVSRAFLGVHWLTDSLAGIALGAVVTLGLRNWMFERGHQFRVAPYVPYRVIVAAAFEVFQSSVSLSGKVLQRANSQIRQSIARRSRNK